MPLILDDCATRDDTARRMQAGVPLAKWPTPAQALASFRIQLGPNFPAPTQKVREGVDRRQHLLQICRGRVISQSHQTK